ncbi:hypothetical protein [Desulfolithobacter sp.]
MSESLKTVEPAYSQADDHWRQLVVMLNRMPTHAAMLLRRPGPAPPPPHSVTDIGTAADRAGLGALCRRHLLCATLLAQKRCHHSWKQHARQTLGDLFPDQDPRTLLHTHWMVFPVLTCQGKTGKVIWCMIGTATETADSLTFSTPFPDPSAQQAIQDVYNTHPLSPESGLFFWTLQDEHEQPLQGRSLQLPLALALHLLNKNKSWPKGLFATGSIDCRNKRILPVAHVEEKYTSVAWENRLFLMPPSPPDQPEIPEASITCATLEEALFILDCYMEGLPPEQAPLIHACSLDLQLLLSRYHELPPPLLALPAFQHLVDQAAREPIQHIGLFSKSLYQCQHSPERAKYLTRFCPAEKMADLIDHVHNHKLELFNWCLAQICYRNHTGDVAGCREWENLASRLRTEMPNEKELGSYFNHRMVTCRFNRYDFRPDPPAEFTGFLEIEERSYQVVRRSNWLLGAMYGTMAQNYGFCGPTWYQKLVDMCWKAESAFGFKHQQETRRLLNYRIYGLLDRKILDEAEQLIHPYVGLQQQATPEDWLKIMLDLAESRKTEDAFILAAALRFFADTREAGKADGTDLPPRALEPIADAICCRTNHPWQLTGLNLARLLQAMAEPDKALPLLHHSLRLCDRGGHTMRAMALLPLAELHQLGSATETDYRQTEKLVRWLARTDTLHRPHFQPLFDRSGARRFLDEILLHRQRYFPFTYR